MVTPLYTRTYGSAIYLSTNTYPQLNWFCYTVYGSYREIDNIQRYALNSAESKTCRAVDEIPNNRKECVDPNIFLIEDEALFFNHCNAFLR